MARGRIPQQLPNHTKKEQKIRKRMYQLTTKSTINHVVSKVDHCSWQWLLWYVILLSTASTKHRWQWHLQNIVVHGIYITSSTTIPTRHCWLQLLHGIIGSKHILCHSIYKTLLAAAFTLMHNKFVRGSYKAPHIILQFYYCVDHQ